MTDRSANEAIDIGNMPLAVERLVEIARHDRPVALAAAARERLVRARAALDQLVKAGGPIYGVTTGLGAAIDIAVRDDAERVQRRVPLARAVAVGRSARRDEVRAMLVARLAGMAVGVSGISPALAETLVALLNARVHPVVPMTGSVGQADLSPLAHLVLPLVGAGEAEWQGQILPGAQALARAGIAVPPLTGKDGLALVSANAAAVGTGALAVFDADRTVQALAGAIALSFEGYRASVAPLHSRVAALRPAPGQGEAAAELRDWLEGGDLLTGDAGRKLQDPLSFRCAAPVLGAVRSALTAARVAIELELNSAGDNPAILADDHRALPNANFDSTHIALAFEGLGLALSYAAAAAAERLVKLMSPVFSGLPRFLTAHQDGRTGFATVQKTIAALVAEIQHAAAPMPTLLMPVADRVEDYGAMTLAIIDKTAGIIARLRLLVAIELVVAAQAIDLRTIGRLGQGSDALYRLVRSQVPTLDDDRSLAGDFAAVASLIDDGSIARLPSFWLY